ncbi:MAG: ribosome-associated translation inhibitor RaiA [Eubacterium sp.]|nr:ribosome-associated translation inhibitor RaiA [Eubacterium sp.]
MKVNITGKNYPIYDKLEDTIEKKLSRLDKYFSDDIVANVVLSQKRGRDKIEVTINAKGVVFRAEELNSDIYEAIDKVVDKLSNQMSKFKGKLAKRYNDNKALKFEFDQTDADEDMDEEEDGKSFEEIYDTPVVKTKKFELRPMDVDEAILEMEMLGHNFFVYLDMDTDSVNVVYKRNGGSYGVLETTY